MIQKWIMRGEVRQPKPEGPTKPISLIREFAEFTYYSTLRNTSKNCAYGSSFYGLRTHFGLLSLFGDEL
jgi:hypothetical protein